MAVRLLVSLLAILALALLLVWGWTAAVSLLAFALLSALFAHAIGVGGELIQRSSRRRFDRG